jgi:hypothetical protein
MLVIERDSPGQHAIEHHADGVQIDAMIERKALRLLGCHVVRRPEHQAAAGKPRIIDHQCVTEIDDHGGGRSDRRQHDVRRLEIAMDDLGGVDGSKAARDISQDPDHDAPR